MTAEERIQAFREKLPDYWPDEVPLVESDAERSWEELGRFWQYCLTAAIFAKDTGKIGEALKVLGVIEDIENESVICDMEYNLMYLQYVQDDGPVPAVLLTDEANANMTYRECWEAMREYWGERVSSAAFRFREELVARNAFNKMIDTERRFTTEGPY
ncbi:MAG: hypothetical protein KAW12_11125 [Candidatus Aminicenantes bacterium]|nr:hypothetical protein [Candidatus Aminicenantes bacterium]